MHHGIGFLKVAREILRLQLGEHLFGRLLPVKIQGIVQIASHLHFEEVRQLGLFGLGILVVEFVVQAISGFLVTRKTLGTGRHQ